MLMSVIVRSAYPNSGYDAQIDVIIDQYALAPRPLASSLARVGRVIASHHWTATVRSEC